MTRPFSRLPLSGAAILLLTLFLCTSVFAQTVVFPGRVVHVVDGDTVTVLTKSNTEFLVRCQGINAPKGPQNYAADSKQRLIDLLLDQPVTVRYAKQDHDGTVVGTILLNDRNICLDQVKVGLARYDDQSEQNRSAQQLYAAAETGARNARSGLWIEPTDTSGSSTVVSNETTAAHANVTVNVRGYFRKDGTYVAAHKRTAPDNNFNNNWSTQGNVNPYTGKVGTKRSRWKTAFKWVGIGATIGALIYLDAKYPTATARCNDGTYSYSQNRRGTCSHHGGVAYWLR